jgi:hypothetical protein
MQDPKLFDQYAEKDINFTSLPVGTRIISIKGETSDTDSVQDIFTGTHAEGIIFDVLPEQEHCYAVNFPAGVSVFLSPKEVADNSNYLVLRRVIARFQPQAWVNDTAMNIDGVCDLDVTDRLLAMSLKHIHLLENDDYPSDELVHGLTDHVGPHYVEVKDSILEFFAVEKLADLTEKILAEQRLHYAAQSSSEKDKLHNVHIYAIVRVKVSNVEAENHAEAIKKAEDMIDLNGLFNRGSDQEFADDIDCFLVDDVGDEEFNHSRWYQKDGVTLMNQPSHTPELPIMNISWTVREALEQARAALPDVLFAAQEGIDRRIIDRINDVLSAVDFSNLELKAVLVDARKALPIAWDKQGGCSDTLLRSIDSALQS